MRLVDPLCELVKVPPLSIGVGMYQHDFKEKDLESRLGAVVEEVVSEVGKSSCLPYIYQDEFAHYYMIKYVI
jgi:hypothetical protein